MIAVESRFPPEGGKAVKGRWRWGGRERRLTPARVSEIDKGVKPENADNACLCVWGGGGDLWSDPIVLMPFIACLQTCDSERFRRMTSRRETHIQKDTVRQKDRDIGK